MSELSLNGDLNTITISTKDLQQLQESGEIDLKVIGEDDNMHTTHLQLKPHLTPKEQRIIDIIGLSDEDITPKELIYKLYLLQRDYPLDNIYGKYYYTDTGIYNKEIMSTLENLQSKRLLKENQAYNTEIDDVDSVLTIHTNKTITGFSQVDNYIQELE